MNKILKWAGIYFVIQFIGLWLLYVMFTGNLSFVEASDPVKGVLGLLIFVIIIASFIFSGIQNDKMY